MGLIGEGAFLDPECVMKIRCARIVCLALVAFTVSGQTNRGTLRGPVSDVTGALDPVEYSVEARAAVPEGGAGGRRACESGCRTGSALGHLLFRLVANALSEPPQVAFQVNSGITAVGP